MHSTDLKRPQRCPATAQPTLVEVWLADLDRHSRELGARDTIEEHRRAARMVDPLRRERLAAAHGALRTVLGRHLGLAPPEVRMVHGRYGKPALDPAHHASLAFSLSQSGSRAAIAVSSREVGVDIEQIVPRRNFVALAARVMEHDDLEAIREQPVERREPEFYARWTRLEARVKCAGSGLAAGDRRAARTLLARAIPVGPGYAGAVATTGEPWHVQTRRLEP